MQKTFEQQIKEIKDSFKARKLTAEETAKIEVIQKAAKARPEKAKDLTAEETAKIAAIKSVEKDRNITEEAKAEIKLRDATKHSKNAAKQAEEAAKQAAKEADKAKIAANKADADAVKAGNKIMIKILGCVSGQFKLSYNIGDKVAHETKQAKEMIKAGVAEKL